MPEQAYDPDTGKFWAKGPEGQWIETPPDKALQRNTPTLEAVKIGAGRTLTQAVAGAQNIGMTVGTAFGADFEAEQATLALEQREARRLGEDLREASPIAMTVGQILPFMPGMMLGAPNVIAQGAIGAFETGVLYEEEAAQQLVNASIGAVAVGGMQGVINRFTRPAAANVAAGRVADDVVQEAQTRTSAATGTGQGVVPPRAGPSATMEKTAQVLSEPEKEIKRVLERYQRPTLEMSARASRADRVAEAARLGEELNADALHLIRLQDASNSGMKIPVAYTLNDDALKLMQTKLETSMFSGRAFNTIQKQNYEAAAARIGDAIGVPGATNLNEGVIDAAHQLAHLDYQDIGRAIGSGIDTRPMRAAAVRALDQTRTAPATATSDQLANRMLTVVRNMEDNGGAVGTELMAWRSHLGKAQRFAQKNGDYLTSEAIDELVEGVDRSIRIGAARAGEDVLDALFDANDRWRMLKTITKGRAINPQGEVNWPTMWTNIKRSYPKYYMENQGVQSERAQRAITAVRAGEYFKDVIGNSGTASRMPTELSLRSAGRGALGMGAARAMTSPQGRLSATQQMVARGASTGPARGTGQTGENLNDLARSTMGPAGRVWAAAALATGG